MKVSIVRFLINKIKSGLGIVQDTDTATQAISKDKYVWWKGSLKKASSNIAATDTLSASNLSDVSEGVLNDINSYQSLKWSNYNKSHIKAMNKTSGAKSAGDTETISFDSCPTGSTQLIGVIATSFGNNNPVRIGCSVVTDKAFIAKFYDGLLSTQVVQYIGFFI